MVKKETYEECYNRIYKMMHPIGMKDGRELSKLVKKKGNFVFPLYRSVLVVTPLKGGQIMLDFFHDPAWLGNERTKKTIKKFKDGKSILLQGQRSGVDVWYGFESRDIAMKISDLFFEELEGVVKKHQKRMEDSWDKAVRKQNKRRKQYDKSK